MNLSEPRDDDRYDAPKYKTRWCEQHDRRFWATHDDPDCPDCLSEEETRRLLLKRGAA